MDDDEVWMDEGDDDYDEGQMLQMTADHMFSLSLSVQLYAKLQSLKADIQDVNDEHVRSRQELEQTQNELTRELKFK